MNDAAQRSIGVVGLGKMGGGIAQHALQRGFRVIGFDKKPAENSLKRAGLSQIESLADFARTLEPPRIVFLYLPAGPLVDDTLDQLSDVLAHGDVIADGGNSYWGDFNPAAPSSASNGHSLCGSGHVRGAGRRAEWCLLHGRRRY